MQLTAYIHWYKSIVHVEKALSFDLIESLNTISSKIDCQPNCRLFFYSPSSGGPRSEIHTEINSLQSMCADNLHRNNIGTLSHLQTTCNMTFWHKFFNETFYTQFTQIELKSSASLRSHLYVFIFFYDTIFKMR